MLSKVLLIVLLALLFVKFILRIRLREFGRRIDRAVNVTLIAIAVVYSAQVVWWIVEGR